MKKLWFLALFAIMTGCVHDVNTDTGMPVIEYTSTQGDSHGFISESERGKVRSVKEFKYKGHNYIQFDIIATHGGRCGIVHNPDCSCFNDSIR